MGQGLKRGRPVSSVVGVLKRLAQRPLPLLVEGETLGGEKLVDAQLPLSRPSLCNFALSVRRKGLEHAPQQRVAALSHLGAHDDGACTSDDIQGLLELRVPLALPPLLVGAAPTLPLGDQPLATRLQRERPPSLPSEHRPLRQQGNAFSRQRPREHRAMNLNVSPLGCCRLSARGHGTEPCLRSLEAPSTHD